MKLRGAYCVTEQAYSLYMHTVYISNVGVRQATSFCDDYIII